MNWMKGEQNLEKEFYLGYTKLKKILICLAMSIVITGCCVAPSYAANESVKTEDNSDLDTHVKGIQHMTIIGGHKLEG